MKKLQSVGLSTVTGALRGCALLLVLFLLLRAIDAAQSWNDFVWSKGGPVPERSSLVVCPPGEKVELLQDNEVILAHSGQSWQLSSIVAPNWIKADGFMYYYVWQGGTGPHGQVDFRGTIEVSKDAPLQEEAKVVFTFEPHHVITIRVRTSRMSFTERWIHPTLEVLAYGSGFGALLGLIAGIWKEWESRTSR